MENTPTPAFHDVPLSANSSIPCNKRTLSTVSERRYDEERSSMLEEVSVLLSMEKSAVPPTSNSAMTEERGKGIMPAFYHQRHKSCHQRKPSMRGIEVPGEEGSLTAVPRKTVSFCTQDAKDKENAPGSEACYSRPDCSQTARSHTRTASDMDSVILGQDESIIEFGPCQSKDSLSQIFELINEGREKGLSIEPGEIALDSQCHTAQDPEVSQNVGRGTLADGIDTSVKKSMPRPPRPHLNASVQASTLLKSQFFDHHFRASRNEFIPNPVLPYCPNCKAHVHTKVTYAPAPQLNFIEQIVKKIKDQFCGSCTNAIRSRPATHKCMHCRTVLSDVV